MENEHFDFSSTQPRRKAGLDGIGNGGGIARVLRGRVLSERIFAWYQFSREGNVEGLLKAYSVRR